MKQYLFAIALAGVAVPALADTGTPTFYSEGGGCFNFVMNGVTYSLPNMGVSSDVIPRGGQATIDGWKALLREVPRGTVTFTRSPGNTEVCPFGQYFVSDGKSRVSSP